MRFLGIICFCAFWAVSAGEAGNLLTNSSFEETLPLKKERYKVELVKDWNCLLNNGSDACDITLANPGLTGQNALRLQTRGKAFSAADYAKALPVSNGDEVIASVMIKGKGTGNIRIYFLNSEGKRLGTEWNKHYRMQGMNAGEQWKVLNMKLTVPEGVAKIRMSLQVIGVDQDVQFDDAKLEIRSGNLLENGKIKVLINPEVGGGIASLVWKEKDFEFTTSNQITRLGGLCQVILPSNAMPGELLRRPFLRSASDANMREYSALINSGALQGLAVRKKYELLDSGVRFTLTLKNTSAGQMKIDQRIQNLVSSRPGNFSWPTPDWLTVFRQTGEPLNGLNSVIQDLFRAGWEAKYYEEAKVALLFEFVPTEVSRMYAFFRMAPSTSTIEWYLRPFVLSPGEEKAMISTISVVPCAGDIYSDEAGKRQKVYEVKPIKMPPVPLQTELPPQWKGFFPYSTGLGNLNQPEMAGFHQPIGSNRQFVILNRRLMRLLVNNYFNAFETTIWGDRHKLFRDEQGRHFQGEMARKLHLKLFLSTLFVYKKDIDVEKYMQNDWPRMKKIMQHPALQAFIQDYQDVIPLIFTGDELLPQNAAVMLRAHQELQEMLPKHILPFPYLNSSTVDLMPYLPVFAGDWYPIKRESASGHNPWSVYHEFSQLVKKAGQKPVWFIPQGFAGGPDTSHIVYALPTAGEYRLMLHLAAAAGCKGIFWHGFPNMNWPWMMNYTLYRYAPMGGAGQLTSSWQGIADVGRDFATVGPLLLVATPAEPPAGATIDCGIYRSTNRFYDGEAVKLFALKTPKGHVLMAVNQNPEREESATLTLPTGRNFNLSHLSEANGGAVKLQLLPGHAAYFYNGSDFEELDAAFRSRFRAESARYWLLAQQAAGDKMEVEDPEIFSSLPPRQALERVLESYAKLQQRITSVPLGKALQLLDAIQDLLDKTDFALCCSLELVVTPEMRKNTPRYERWCAHPDPEYNRLREELVSVMADYYRLRDGIEEGRGSNAAQQELPALYKKTCQVTTDIGNWLQKHPEKIHDPFK